MIIQAKKWLLTVLQLTGACLTATVMGGLFGFLTAILVLCIIGPFYGDYCGWMVAVNSPTVTMHAAGESIVVAGCWSRFIGGCHSPGVFGRTRVQQCRGLDCVKRRCLRERRTGNPGNG